MAKDKPLEQMTFSELNAHSAKLYEQLYALKSEIQKVQQWRNQRGAEEDAARSIAEAQERIASAKAVIASSTVISAESIKSDEGFGHLGGGFKKLATRIMKTISGK